jgi:hypothetical protein
VHGLIEDFVAWIKLAAMTIVTVALVTLAIMCLMGMHGCASMAVGKDATPEQKRMALCQDAMIGQAILTQVPGFSTEENHRYWDNYRAAVDVAIKTYCAGWVVQK